MPTYAGECVHCGYVEYWGSLSYGPATECPDCDASGFKPQIAGTGVFALKGCGWAVDGYDICSHPRWDKGGK